MSTPDCGLLSGIWTRLGFLTVLVVAALPAGAEPDRTVLVAVRELTRAKQTITLPVKVGILEAAASLPLSFEVAGRVARILGEGVQVNEGDKIAQLDTELEVAEVERAQLRLADAQRDFARLRGLRKAQATSASTLESAATAAKLRRTELDLVQERLDRRHLEARFAGIIADVRVDPGEVVVPGKVVARLLNFDLLKIEVGVPGHQIGDVMPGARVEISVPSLRDSGFSGLVHAIAPAAAEGSVLFAVEILIPNPEGHLKPGMSARARIVSREVEDALSIPLETSVARSGQRVVFFVQDGRAREKTVEEAWLHGDRLVLTGATPGDALVVRGQHDLDDDVAVHIDDSVLRGTGPDSRIARPVVMGP